jgi:ABC-type transport system involved in cytochrome c biogenesis permease subunit
MDRPVDAEISKVRQGAPEETWTPRTMVDFAAWGHNVGCCLQFDRRFSPLLLRPLLRSKL